MCRVSDPVGTRFGHCGWIFLVKCRSVTCGDLPQDLPEIHVKDYEFVETWIVQDYDGPVNFNLHEVQEVQWLAPQEVTRQMASDPSQFTAWFLDEWKRVKNQHLSVLASSSPLPLPPSQPLH